MKIWQFSQAVLKDPSFGYSITYDPVTLDVIEIVSVSTYNLGIENASTDKTQPRFANLRAKANLELIKT